MLRWCSQVKDTPTASEPLGAETGESSRPGFESRPEHHIKNCERDDAAVYFVRDQRLVQRLAERTNIKIVFKLAS